jgi:hypothetical protein
VNDVQLTFVDAELNQNELERAFMRKVNELAPDVRRTLAGEPFSLYQQFSPPQAVWIKLSANKSILALKSALRGVEPVIAKSIEDWLKQWKLRASWCRVSAYFTLQLWVENGGTLYRDRLFHPPPLKQMKRLEPPSGLPRYYVEEGRESYRNRLTHDLKRTLSENFPPSALAKVSQRNAFIDHIVNQAVHKYCKAAEALQPLTESTGRRQLDKHLEWAVRVHVKGDKQATIVQELRRKGHKHEVTPAAVSIAIKSILQDLCLIS